MNKNSFFMPTIKFKEYMILDLIDKNPRVTQRFLSERIGSSVSMINTYIDEYEKKEYLVRYYISNKQVEYIITKKGKERKKLLNMSYLKSSHSIYVSAKENILSYLNLIIEKGFRNIFLYGAGEIAEIILNVVTEDKAIPINILGIIDDDSNKITKKLVNYEIFSTNQLFETIHDGVLVSSFAHKKEIYNNLVSLKYCKERILLFFEL